MKSTQLKRKTFITAPGMRKPRAWRPSLQVLGRTRGIVQPRAGPLVVGKWSCPLTVKALDVTFGACHLCGKEWVSQDCHRAVFCWLPIGSLVGGEVSVLGDNQNLFKGKKWNKVENTEWYISVHNFLSGLNFFKQL